MLVVAVSATAVSKERIETPAAVAWVGLALSRIQAAHPDSLFAIAFALVCAINADSFAIGQRLWKDDALRAAVVAQANQAVSSKNASCQSATGNPESSSVAPTTKAADCVNQVKALGLPLGWSSATSPHSITSGLGKAIGLLVTIFALSLGAPFWFDLLGKVANLRSAGAPPPPATSTNAPTSPAQ